ncbi:hypothetical protein [Natronospora cellulosivora (SeqCode)]
MILRGELDKTNYKDKMPDSYISSDFSNNNIWLRYKNNKIAVKKIHWGTTDDWNNQNQIINDPNNSVRS